MKLITLLNKIAKGENFPLNIIYNGENYYYDENEGTYRLCDINDECNNNRYLEDFCAIINKDMLNKQVYRR